MNLAEIKDPNVKAIIEAAHESTKGTHPATADNYPLLVGFATSILLVFGAFIYIAVRHYKGNKRANQLG